MVATNKVFSPQNFVEVLTDRCYVFDGENDIDMIHAILVENGIEGIEDDTLWDYPLNEIDEISRLELDVVLVEVCYFDEDFNLQKEFRWFEIPARFVSKFKKA